MRVAVTGGTGLIGRMVVDALREAGHVPVVLARSTGADLTTGSGVDAALRGIDVLIDASNLATVSAGKSVRFFDAATRTLLDAERRLGIGHHIVLSIVGAAEIDAGYYRGKRRQEDLVLAGPVPATILRATQFFEFAAQMIDRGGPVVFVPRMLSQPIAAREVADALVALVDQPPSGIVPDLAGPEQLHMPDMVRRLLRARGSNQPTVGVRLPGAAGRAFASGALLPRTDGPRGHERFEQWLVRVA